MKFKTTKKAIREGYVNVITIGYCDAQFLLQGLEPNSYCSGVYGWSCDNYQYSYNTCISTGYAPVEGIRNYELTREYDKKAREIYENYEIDYQTRLEMIKKLRDEYVRFVWMSNND